MRTINRIKLNQIIKTTPQKWTVEEEEQLYKEYNQGKTIKDLQKIHNRSYASINAKLKRIKQKKGTYNQPHADEKNLINKQFIQEIQPRTILDLYSNRGTLAYNGLDVYRNDINKEFNLESNRDALVCLCDLYSQKRQFDLIDLDPYGGGYDCFDLAIKMAKKGLCITFGELGAKRWGRLDYVQYRYGFNSLNDFTLENMVTHVQHIGLRNKKKLEIFSIKEWNSIGRVWFIVKPFKEYGQWDLDKPTTTTLDNFIK